MSLVRFTGVQTVLATLLLSALTPVWADHSAPAPQLSGVTLCLELSSIRLETEGIAQLDSERVRGAILDVLQRQLEAQNVLYTSECATSSSYILLNLYARFLDPRTYIGFPKNSYTYVTTAQVGSFVEDGTTETVLAESIYSASGSDIFQATTAERLEQRLVMLGAAEAEALTQTWLEANAVTLGSYLLFTALGLSFVALRVLSAVLR